MSEIIAIFENGVLRPLRPLSLGEGQKVRLQVLAESQPDNELEQALQPLIEAGVLIYPPGHGDSPVSEAQLRQLTESLKALCGKPLSEIIIEDRGML